jgi:hypothetical protein
LLVLSVGPCLAQQSRPEQIISISAGEYQYDGIVRALESYGVSVVIGPDVIKDSSRKVYVSIRNKPLHDALDAIAAGFDAHWRAFGEVYVLEPGREAVATGVGGFRLDGARGIISAPAIQHVFDGTQSGVPLGGVAKAQDIKLPATVFQVAPGTAQEYSWKTDLFKDMRKPLGLSGQPRPVTTELRSVDPKTGKTVITHIEYLSAPPIQTFGVTSVGRGGGPKAQLLDSISDAQWNEIWARGYARLRDLTKPQREQLLGIAHGKLTHTLVLTDRGRRLVVKP